MTGLDGRNVTGDTTADDNKVVFTCGEGGDEQSHSGSVEEHSEFAITMGKAMAYLLQMRSHALSQ